MSDTAVYAECLSRYAQRSGMLMSAIERAVRDLENADLGWHVSPILRDLRRALNEARDNG